MASLPAIICFGIACVLSLVYGKLSEDHPVKPVIIAGLAVCCVVGANL
jgi:hypothetical protein